MRFYKCTIVYYNAAPRAETLLGISWLQLLCHPCFDVRARPVVLWPSRVSASHRSSPRWRPSGLTGFTSNGGRHKLEQRTQSSGNKKKKTCGPDRLAPPKVSNHAVCWVHFLGTRGHHVTMAVKVLPWKANVATINSHPEWDNLGKKYWDSVPFHYPLPLPRTPDRSLQPWCYQEGGFLAMGK